MIAGGLIRLSRQAPHQHGCHEQESPDDKLERVRDRWARMWHEIEQEPSRAKRDGDASDEVDDEHAAGEARNAARATRTCSEVERRDDHRRVDRVGQADR